MGANWDLQRRELMDWHATMTSALTDPVSTPASSPRLGRALFYVHQQTQVITNPVIKAKLAQLSSAQARPRPTPRLSRTTTGATAMEFAAQAGIGPNRLMTEVLPKLKEADLVAYAPDLVTGGVATIEEFVGLTGRIIEQSMKVTEKYQPTAVELAVLHSTELAR